MAKAHKQVVADRRAVSRLDKQLRSTPRHSMQYSAIAQQLELMRVRVAKAGRL